MLYNHLEWAHRRSLKQNQKEIFVFNQQPRQSYAQSVSESYFTIRRALGAAALAMAVPLQGGASLLWRTKSKGIVNQTK